MQKENILEIKNLLVEYKVKEGAVRSVDNVNLNIEKNRFTAIIGESGCGKSTLNNVIMDVLAPNAYLGPDSELLFDGRDLLKMDKEEFRQFRWRKAAMVFQAAQNALNPLLRISAQFLDVIEDHDIRPKRKRSLERIEELLKLVRLDSKRVLTAYPHELSGGMRQRTIIALSLILDPQFLILDEPTSALDIITQSYVFDILADIYQRLGLSIILITHDIAAAARLANNVVVMYAGRIFEVNDVHTIFRAPKHPYTRGLLNATPSIEGETIEKNPIPGSPPDLLSKPKGCLFHPRCQHAEDVCRQTIPELLDAGDNQLVACHKWERT